MDDNVPPHRARIVQQHLEHESIIHIECHVRLFDCNPTEHLWGILQLTVARRWQHPRSLRELENVLVAEWNAVSQTQVQRLVTSMRRQYQALIAAEGSHTRYWTSHYILLPLELAYEKKNHFDKMCKLGGWPLCTLVLSHRLINFGRYDSLMNEMQLCDSDNSGTSWNKCLHSYSCVQITICV
jgi:hypothetical protein